MSLFAARTALLATKRVVSTQRRRMGAAAAAPEWTGIDKVVRGYFPGDDQREYLGGMPQHGLLGIDCSFSTWQFYGRKEKER